MKSNKNGFTLVELLAVIVILALIMIIAIPSVMTVVNNARRQSFYLYAESIQSKALAKYQQDIGGLDVQKQELRESVELPLLHPEIFTQIGIDPPRGVSISI